MLVIAKQENDTTVVICKTVKNVTLNYINKTMLFYSIFNVASVLLKIALLYFPLMKGHDALFYPEKLL